MYKNVISVAVSYVSFKQLYILNKTLFLFLDFLCYLWQLTSPVFQGWKNLGFIEKFLGVKVFFRVFSGFQFSRFLGF